MPLAHTLFYSAHERGPHASRPLVLVHGAGGHHLHWPSQVRHLPTTTVYAVDLPGHGQSPGSAPGLADMVAAVRGLLDDLQIEQAVIGGHSLGGAIAQRLALEHPERVAGLILVATSARLRVAPQILDNVLTDFPGTAALIIEWEFGAHAPEPLKRLAHQRLLEVDPHVLRADFQACEQFDERERVRQIRAPTLILCGTEDHMTPTRYSQALAQALPHSELRLFPDAGHMVMLEQPGAVAHAIAEFMAKLA